MNNEDDALVDTYDLPTIGLLSVAAGFQAAKRKFEEDHRDFSEIRLSEFFEALEGFALEYVEKFAAIAGVE